MTTRRLPGAAFPGATLRKATLVVAALVATAPGATAARAQDAPPAESAAAAGPARADALPRGFGTLSQNDLALRLRNDDLEIRFVPLDPRVTRLLARDAYESLRGLVVTRRRAIDSIAARAGVTEPGLALVSFFGQRSGARFDAQSVTVVLRNRTLQPLGIAPVSPRFNAQQLGVRDQVSAIYVFEEDLPVDDSFSVSYGLLRSEDWEGKQSLLNRERARTAARAREDTARRR